MYRLAWIAALSVALTTSAGAQAPATPTQRPALLKSLTDCRSVSDSAVRLACFDAAAAAIDTAERAKDLVVVDREQLRKTRRTLFGLTLPNLSVFGDDSSTEPGVERIETTIARLSQTGFGKWIFVLPDGATWEQIDSRELPIDPKVGNSIKIRKAAMGSYLANVKEQVAIRVKRLR
jgi:hypothetical protein